MNVAANLDRGRDPDPAESDHSGLADAILEKLPSDVRATLGPDQVVALRRAANDVSWSSHKVNIRLTIPTVFNKYYLVILGGRERRDRDRIAAERRRHPLYTLSNLLFLLGVGGLAVYFSSVIIAMFVSLVLPLFN